MSTFIETGITPFDVSKIRKDFPILQQKIHGKPLVYLDNAATTQKPKIVIDILTDYYASFNSNIHRGVHYMSEKATFEYEEARTKIQKYINALSNKEIIFVRGTSEAINLVASSYGRTNIKKGDEVIISAMEHHSNIVPWQMLCEEKEALLRVIPINDQGEIIFEEYEKLLNERTKLVSIVHVSNSLGTINPIKEIIKKAHEYDVPVLIDGAQAIQHIKVDVQDLDCDFYAFSGHKIYGPTGIGVLYGKEKILNAMPPYQGGGDMISSVSFEKTIYNILPYKFEAGTPHIEGGIGLGAAIDYVDRIGVQSIQKYEADLLSYATQVLSEVEGLEIIGTAKDKTSVISFVMKNIHPHDLGTALDRDGIAIRTGHHCTQPVMTRFNIPATSRMSLAMYNTKEDVDKLVAGIHKAIKIFS